MYILTINVLLHDSLPVYYFTMDWWCVPCFVYLNFLENNAETALAEEWLSDYYKINSLTS